MATAASADTVEFQATQDQAYLDIREVALAVIPVFPVTADQASVDLAEFQAIAAAAFLVGLVFQAIAALALAVGLAFPVIAGQV